VRVWCFNKSQNNKFIIKSKPNSWPIGDPAKNIIGINWINVIDQTIAQIWGFLKKLKRQDLLK